MSGGVGRWGGAEGVGGSSAQAVCTRQSPICAHPPPHVLTHPHTPAPPALQRCLTPPSALGGDSGFLAANLYARSVFGEDALVNVSVEALPDGRLGGYIRIRCALRWRGWGR